jgi:hypothetical protein
MAKIAAYAADIVFVSNIASLLEGWYIDHLSWHWIFWTAALFSPVMMLCVHFGILVDLVLNRNQVGMVSHTSAWVWLCYMGRWIKDSGWTG